MKYENSWSCLSHHKIEGRRSLTSKLRSAIKMIAPGPQRFARNGLNSENRSTESGAAYLRDAAANQAPGPRQERAQLIPHISGKQEEISDVLLTRRQRDIGTDTFGVSALLASDCGHFSKQNKLREPWFIFQNKATDRRCVTAVCRTAPLSSPQISKRLWGKFITRPSLEEVLRRKKKKKDH